MLRRLTEKARALRRPSESASNGESRTLPAEFDPNFYRATYPDMNGKDDGALLAHWEAHGISEGRAGSPAATRDGFIGVLDRSGSILEIGPLANPIVRGPHVSYFDVLPTDGLKEKAALHQLDVENVPEITYYSEVADLAVIPDRFDSVVSSHNIEHQTDLVQHLSAVANLLVDGGRYFLAIPDQRFCFDHFVMPSTIADVLGAHARLAMTHDPGDIIESLAFTTHNDPVRHWSGDHGEPAFRTDSTVLLSAVQHYTSSSGYIDSHAWQFTPEGFRDITSLLFTLGLSRFRPIRVYQTLRNSLEFYAVLELESSD